MNERNVILGTNIVKSGWRAWFDRERSESILGHTGHRAPKWMLQNLNQRSLAIRRNSHAWKWMKCSVGAEEDGQDWRCEIGRYLSGSEGWTLWKRMGGSTSTSVHSSAGRWMGDCTCYWFFSIQSAALLLQMEGHSEEQLLEQTELQCLGASMVWT